MLKKFLHKLDNTGEKGFEGLVRRLLRDLSGFEFRLSRSGSQHGRDARAVGRDSGSIMFECKNYESAKLKNRELIAELTEALEDDPSLDLWILAASTAVPEQSELQLRNLANKNGIEFIGLETGETDPGLLDCLCANSPDKLLEALGNVGASTTEIAEAKVAMSQIAALPGFLNRIEELRRQVTEPSLGWPAWRRSADKKWLNFVSDENSSRARFGQPLHLLSPATHLVSRREAMIALEDWWANWNINKSIFFMLGEEGDGKTWAVAQWLTNRIQTEGANSPPVIFISSKDAIGNGTMEEIILARIEQEFGRAKWKKRLRRWRKALSDQPERPFAIVVLDGLNERHNATYWRNVIDDSLAKEWKQSAAIICTARTGYWKEFFEPLSYLPTTRYVIKGYDNNEINNALSSRNQHLTDFPDTLHPLLRKPRYLDLAMKHRKELTECGDFTVARLIYEDWRDRYNRKSSFPLSNDQFNEMLKGLGKQFLDGQKQWQPNELISQFSLNEDSLQTFKELSTGGVLERVESGWQIQAQSLALGLGLLLCDQLKEAEQSQQDLQETLASWIEPCSGTDLISQALELAALHSLMTDHTRAVRLELLSAWLNTQNPGEQLEDTVIRKFSAYLPDNINTYFYLIEKMWSARIDNRCAQEILLRGLLKWSHESVEVYRALPVWLDRWLGMVPIGGPPNFRRSKEADKYESLVREQLTTLFGKDAVKVNEIVVLDDHSFTLINDDGWIRLARAALAIISSFGDRKPFLPQIVTGMMADSLLSGEVEYPEKKPLLQWLLRSAPQELEQDLFTITREIAKSSVPASRRAAARLAAAVGTSTGWSHWETNQDELFPEPEWVKQARTKPFESILSVTKEELEAYPEDSNFLPYGFLRHCGESVIDRTLSPRGNLKVLLAPIFDRFTDNPIWEDGNLSHSKLFLDQYEPILARYCPEQLCNVIRENITEAAERTRQGQFKTKDKDPLFRLVFDLTKHELILTESERRSLLAVWQNRQVELLSGDDLSKCIEGLLFQSLLPLWRGDEQLRRILERNGAAFVMPAFSNYLSVDNDTSMSESLLVHELERLVYLLALVKQRLLTKEQLRKCAQTQSDSLPASLLRYLHSCQDANDIADWLSLVEWRWKPDMNYIEREFGTSLVVHFAKDITLENLLERVPPSRHGTALISRTVDTKEYVEYAKWVSGALSDMLDFPVPLNLPRIEIIYDSNLPTTIYPVTVLHDEESRGLHFVQPENVWGGDNIFESPDFNLGIEETNSRWKTREQYLADTVKQGSAAGHHWVSDIFHKDALKEAVIAAPELADSWIDKAVTSSPSSFSNLYRGRSFFQTLCVVLFDLPSRHEDASKLYGALNQTGKFRNMVMPQFGIPVIAQALMSAHSSSHTERLWLEILDSATSDGDIFEIALLLRTSGTTSDAHGWYEQKIRQDLQSNIPYFQARAYTLLGFLEQNEKASWLCEPIDDDTYWLKEVQKAAQRQFAREKDCTYWFREFCKDEDLDKAWSSFMVFLKCVDRRAWLWLENEALALEAGCKKLRFLDLNRSTIASACNQNEKRLQDIFIGCKRDQNLYPWLKFPS